MTRTQPRYNSEEHARSGNALYEQQVRSQVEAAHHGRLQAIDIESDIYEVAVDTMSACQRLVARQHDAQLWRVHIGHPAVHRFGPRVRAVQP